MQKQNQRVFIISLDGATFDVLRPLIAQGHLPNLAKFMRSGLSAELESVIPPVTAPAWTSFMTGKNPNKHGIFDFTRFDVNDYEWKINNAQHVRSRTIWQLLSEKGKRVAVLNLPYTYPAYEVNGVMVAGWDAPTTKSFTYPEELRNEIMQLIPDYGAGLDLSLWNYLPAESDSEFTQFIGKLVRSFEQSTMLASHFLHSRNWDVFMVHFQQTDWIQHKLWGYIERACRIANDKSSRLEQVRECYRTFDRNVGRLLEETAALNATTIILSDHGFGPNRGSICPNYVLRNLGYYNLRQQAESRIKGSFKHSRYKAVRSFYRSLTAAKNAVRGRQAVNRYKSWADMANETVPRQKTMVDWTRTKVAFVGGSETGLIFVNVKGRGKFGCVEPGVEYEEIVSRVISEFSALKHPKTGEPLFTRVVRGRDIYSGPSDGVLLPDIVLMPVEGYVVAAGMSEPFLPEGGEQGDHRHNGILLMQGPDLRLNNPNFSPNLIDMAPTVLHILGLPVPADMDGRVLEEVFAEPQPIRFDSVDNSRLLDAQDYSGEEAQLIEQRLRGLGYVE